MLALPTFEELRALSNEVLIETSAVHTRRGGAQIAIVRVEYLTQKLVRRDQAKQNSFLNGLTVAIGIT
jgi:hypothetical protein